MENVIIFGGSTRGVYVYNTIKNDYNIEAFVDNDKEKWGTKLEGIEIKNPTEIYNFDGKIIIASQYDKEIKEQLRKNNVRNFEVYSSSIEVMLKRIQDKGIDIGSVNAIQLFGGTGNGMERFYKDKVNTLDVWEIEESYEKQLKKNLPNANIKIVDSFKEINTTKKRYDMILLDNPMAVFGEHAEHFDMFMNIFKIMREECVVILDIIPNLTNLDMKYSYLLKDENKLSRKMFYRVIDPINIKISDMVSTYKEISEKNGYMVEWFIDEERSGDFIKYLALKLKKKGE